ncbi:hypothetical protein BJ875DRAFT_89502 [Amylocarpus encephaloides]|uniref:GET complex subunit GET2 n=1 Tax=Amylocarpus encephaloides TaxID=45428 RepID=A0A9P8C3P1_9HELO|nr:hypothetical protein BJ875DRAFT_89502 [Amylocarpus encephaloides]
MPDSAEAAASSRAAEQARLRKEKREAKIKAGGSARLNKITGLGGGIQRDAPTPPTQHADPDEVYISEHYYQPARPASNANSREGIAPSDEQLRQMMLGFDPASTANAGANGNPFAGFPAMDGMGGPQGGAEDPMMQMMRQMLGGVPGEGQAGMPNFPGVGPMPGMPGQAQPAAPVDPYAHLWRVVHAVFAVALGVYIAFTTTFTGTKAERERSKLSYSADQDSLSPGNVQFFWIFATAELLLQSSRFFLEKGKIQPQGWLATINGFLPPAYKGYLALFLRYARIWTTLSGDAMTCVFVLGVCVWLRGGQAA